MPMYVSVTRFSVTVSPTRSDDAPGLATARAAAGDRSITREAVSASEKPRPATTSMPSVSNRLAMVPITRSARAPCGERASTVTGIVTPATCPAPSSDASSSASAGPHCTTESSGTEAPSTVRLVSGFTPMACRSVVSET